MQQILAKRIKWNSYSRCFVELCIFCFFISLSACDFNNTDSQSIEINVFDDEKKNAYLAKELLFYDLKYLIYKIPSFTPEIANGVKLGYYVGNGNKSFYKVTYLLRNLVIKNNLNKLKQDFHKYITELAIQHANNEELFNHTGRIGTKLIENLFSNNVKVVWNESSAKLQGASSYEKIDTYMQKFHAKYGGYKQIEFMYAQYYEAFDQIPEHVSLIYKMSFERKDDVKALINLSKEDDYWKLVGFNFF